MIRYDNQGEELALPSELSCGGTMNEIKRIFSCKFLVLLVVMLLLNAVVLIKNNKPESSKSLLFDSIIRFSADVKTQDMTNREAVIEGFQKYVAQNNIDTKNLSDDEKQTRLLALEKADYIDSFDEEIKDKIDHATKILSTDMLDKNSFERNNLLKSRYDLIQIKDRKPELSNGIWLEKLFHYHYIQIFIVVLVCFSIYGFFAERKAGLYAIIHSGAHGRIYLMLKRVAIIMTETLVLSLIFYFESAIILISLHGGISGIHDPALSDEAFLLTSMSLTRIQFVLLLTLISAVFAAAAGLLLWLFLNLFANVNNGLVVFIIICGIDILIFRVIDIKMILRFLHCINFYYFIYPHEAIQYNNWGYSFGVVSVLEGMVAVAVILALFAVVCMVFVKKLGYYSGRGNFVERIIEKISESNMQVVAKLPLWFKEAYKILISQRCLAILLVLLVISGNMNIGMRHIYSFNESILLGFYKDAEGLPYGEELEKIYEKYELEYEEFLQTVDGEDSESETQIRFRKGILDQIKGCVTYLKAQAEKGHSAKCITPYEYNDALGEKQKENQMMLALMNVLAVIIVSSGFMSYENKNGIKPLIMAAANRKKWLSIKIITNCSIITVFSLLSYGIYYYRLSQVYELTNLSFPVKSLAMFDKLPINPSIAGFIAIDVIAKIIFLSGLSILISALSAKLPYLYCMLAGVTVIIPQLLYMLGFEMMENFSIGRYVAFFPAFNSKMAGVYYIFWLLIVMLAGITMYGILHRRNRGYADGLSNRNM